MSGKELGEHARIQFALCALDAGLECVGSIGGRYADAALGEDRSTIIIARDEVGGTARFADPGGEHRLVYAQPVHAFAPKIRK